MFFLLMFRFESLGFCDPKPLQPQPGLGFLGLGGGSGVEDGLRL